MTDRLEGIRDYLPSFTKALENSGAEASTIRSFRAYWDALPPGQGKRPCPVCYARGQQGWLFLVSANGHSRAECERCGGQFAL